MSCTAKNQDRKFETNIPKKKLRGDSPNFHIHVSVEIGTEAAQFPAKEYVHKWDFCCSVLCLAVSIAYLKPSRLLLKE
jgi:hypothetical protein